MSIGIGGSTAAQELAKLTDMTSGHEVTILLLSDLVVIATNRSLTGVIPLHLCTVKTMPFVVAQCELIGPPDTAAVWLRATDGPTADALTMTMPMEAHSDAMAVQQLGARMS